MQRYPNEGCINKVIFGISGEKLWAKNFGRIKILENGINLHTALQRRVSENFFSNSAKLLHFRAEGLYLAYKGCLLSFLLSRAKMSLLGKKMDDFLKRVQKLVKRRIIFFSWKSWDQMAHKFSILKDQYLLNASFPLRVGKMFKNYHENPGFPSLF